MENPSTKIVHQKSAQFTVHNWQLQGLQIVFTNGCFDLLHPGHCDYLWKARALGDKLVIGLNTDASVQRLKGKHRPIQSEQARALILASLSFVDLVVLFEEDTPESIIQSLNPDILVKGGDYTPEKVVGREWVEEHGGRIEIIPFLDGYSTSIIEKKILEFGKQ